MVPVDVALGSFDLSDPEFWLSSREYREGAFATLRREQPISWHDEWEFVGTPFPKGPGYWPLAKICGLRLTCHTSSWLTNDQ